MEEATILKYYLHRKLIPSTRNLTRTLYAKSIQKAIMYLNTKNELYYQSNIYSILFYFTIIFYYVLYFTSSFICVDSAIS